MIELHARLYCDRCDTTLVEMNDVEDEAEARRRLAETDWGGSAEDEDGNDVCAECWKKWDAKQSGASPAADRQEGP